MPRRISPSQIRSKLRQFEQKQRRAINDYNREVRKHNQKVKQAVSATNREINRYNSAVRQHNSRVRANRERLRRELTKLSNQSNKSTFVAYRETVRTVQSSYERLEGQAEAGQFDDSYNEILDLSEQEAANNASVMNVLDGLTPEPTGSPADSIQKWMIEFLNSVSSDLLARWRGALFSLNPENPDAARHFCTSAREVITQILEIKAQDAEVFSLLPECERTERGNPTRRAKIRFFLHRRQLFDEHLEEFVERDIEGVVQLFRVFNDGTHGSAGTFDYQQLTAIRKRVEDGIAFLSKIVG